MKDGSANERMVLAMAVTIGWHLVEKVEHTLETSGWLVPHDHFIAILLSFVFVLVILVLILLACLFVIGWLLFFDDDLFLFGCFLLLRSRRIDNITAGGTFARLREKKGIGKQHERNLQ